MGITVEIIHRLCGKKFDELYTQHQAKWVDMTANARTYAESFISDGDLVRPGDISQILQNAVKVDPHFEAHMAAKKLNQKYWARDFSDYILDKIYPPNV